VKKFLFVNLMLLLSGCAGLAVGTFVTFESEQNDVSISSERNSFDYEVNPKPLSKDELISAWGEPDESYSFGSCEVVTYYDGYSWSGFGAFVVVIPLPILVPTGHDENRFYFINDQSVGLVKEYGEVSSALGYMCGSNECNGLAGPVNENKRKVDVKWCE